MAQDGFITFLLEQMEQAGGVSARRMFGGHGVYLHGLMFGLVADDTLYLKVDDESRPEFEERELGPFTYQRDGKPFAMSYYEAPPETLDEPSEMTRWVEFAFDAALRESRRKAAKGAKRMTAKKQRASGKNSKKFARRSTAKKKRAGKPAKPAAKKTTARVVKKAAKKSKVGRGTSAKKVARKRR